MALSAPLQILLFRHLDDLDMISYEDAIVRAFQGGNEMGGYLTSREDLGIQMEVFSAAPALGVVETLDSFCHTVTIVLVDSALLDKADDAFWNWLATCWTHT